jgi:iron complex outermembrane receptor protein
VSHIEVLKGPASLAYGSDALAGVVNIVSDEIIPEGKIKGNAAANYQTNNGMGVLHANVAGNQKGFNWKLYGTGKAAHDYKNSYDGSVFNSRFNNVNYGAMIGLDRKWGNSRLSFSRFGQTLGLVEGTRDSTTGKFVKEVNDNGTIADEIVTASDAKGYSPQIPSQQITHTKLVWNNSIYLRKGARVGVILGYQQNVRKEYADILQPTTAGLEFVLQTFTYDLKYYFPAWKGWHMTSGINGMQQQNANKGTEFLIPDYKLFDAGIYSIAKKDWKRLSLSGGLRYNYRTIDVYALQLGAFQQFTGFNNSFSNLVGSIGASYMLSKRMALKLNVGRGFRAPNAAELSANGVHEGTIRYEYGNAGLKAESSMQFDLGLNWNSEHIMINASAFYNTISNYIYLQKLIGANGTDSIPSDNNADGFTAFQFSQANAGIYGGELYIDFHPHPFDWLHLDNTLSYVRGVIYNSADSTRNLPSMPPIRWQIELKAHAKSVNKRIKNAYAKAGLQITFAQNNIFNAYSTETVTPGYTVINAGLGFDWVSRKKQLICSINTSLNNIANMSYQDHLNRLKYADLNNVTGRQGVCNMGRNLSISVNVPFDIR